MRLRTRLLLSVTAVTAAALLASFIPLYVLVASAETRELDHALFRHAYAAAQRIPLATAPGRRLDDGWVRVPESLEPTARYLAVYGPDGALVDASRSFTGQAPALQDLGLGEEIAWDGEAVDLVVGAHVLRGVVIPLHADGELLLYAASQRSVVDDEQYLYRLLLLLFFGATLVTSLVARWVGERLAGDVHAIARVARKVAEGDLRARVGAVAIGSDDTRALAHDLDHMISQLGALVESQRTFISHAAHELRSPLATLRGELQLALRRPRDADGYQRALGEMLADVESLVRLAEDLLLLARLQAKAAPERESSPLDGVIHDALRMARGRAEERGTALQLHGVAAAIGVQVWGARGELARLLRNLIDNAIAHSPPGTAVDLTLELGDEVVLAVRGAGPGVRPEDRAHIFAPFYRGLQNPGSSGGAGLGLSIARAIAEACGGKVELDEAATGGARFTVRLARAETLTSPA